MLPSTQVRTVIASLLLAVATLVVVVPSAGLWEPPLDAPFASHVLDGHDATPSDDRPSNSAAALHRSDSLGHWVLLSIAVLAVLLLAPRSTRARWVPVRSDDRVPRSPLLRGTRTWRAPPSLV